jgi:hypothetical protein
MQQQKIGLTVVVKGCTDGSCDRVWATTQPGMIGIQGRKPSSVPARARLADHESLTYIPEGMLLDWARGRLTELGELGG